MWWESHGIKGKGSRPSLAGQFSGNLLIISTGWCVWNDIERFKLLGFETDDDGKANCDVMAVNGMTLYWRGRLHHAVSLHPDEPELWIALRRVYSCNLAHTWTHSIRKPEPPAKIEFVWDMNQGRGGTSSLFAVCLGIALGYERIMLAGIPLDDGGYCYAPPNGQSRFGSLTQQLEWRRANRDYFNDRVRSFSGRTRKWLGDVSQEWLAGESMTAMEGV